MTTQYPFPFLPVGFAESPKVGADLDYLLSFIQAVDTIVSVKSYGAIGDGINDDTVSFQLAIATGNSVFVPPVSNPSTQFYKITSAISLNSNQRIFGSGYASLIKQTTYGENIISAISKNYIEIDNLNLYAIGTRSTGIDGCGVFLSSCTNSSIRNCYAQNPGSAGLMLYNTDDSSIESCTIFNGASAPLQEVDIFIKGSSSRNIVRGNRCISAGDSGIFIQSLNLGDTMTDNLVIGNEISTHNRYGIIVYRVNDSGTCRRNSIVGNTIRDITGSSSDDGGITKNFGAGIYISSAEDTLIEGNTIYNTNISTANNTLAPGAIGTQASSRVSIIGNNIISPNWYGITVRDPQQIGDGTGSGGSYATNGGVLVEGNNIYQCGSNYAQIHVLDHHNVSIVGNKCHSSLNEGIFVEITAAGNYTVLNNMQINTNIVTGAADRGILLKNCNYLQMANNIVRSSISTNLEIDTAQYVSVVGNIISDGSARGIWMRNTIDDAVASGNVVTGNSTGMDINGACVLTGNHVLSNTTNWAGTNGIPIALSTGTATPTIKSGTFFTMSASGTAVTNFTNGEEGQILNIQATGNRTINHDGANIFLNAAANFAMVTNNILSLMRISGVWYELSRKV